MSPCPSRAEAVGNFPNWGTTPAPSHLNIRAAWIAQQQCRQMCLRNSSANCRGSSTWALSSTCPKESAGLVCDLTPLCHMSESMLVELWLPWHLGMGAVMLLCPKLPTILLLLILVRTGRALRLPAMPKHRQGKPEPAASSLGALPWLIENMGYCGKRAATVG